MATRREFLKTTTAGLSSQKFGRHGKGMIAAASVLQVPGPQKYGTGEGREAFQQHWADLPTGKFHHREHRTFHRLQTQLDFLYCRCRQPLLVGLGGSLRKRRSGISNPLHGVGIGSRGGARESGVVEILEAAPRTRSQGLGP